MNTQVIIKSLPYWAQNMVISASSAIQSLNDNRFYKALREYESHNNWTYEQMCDYRDEKLRKIIHHCYSTVPYYKKLFDEGGINPDRIKALDDITIIPVLTKQDIVRNPSDFFSTNCRITNLVNISTSGSTGSSLVLKVKKDNIFQQNAIWWRYYHRLGINKNLRKAEFNSSAIIPKEQQKPPYWRKNYYSNTIQFSTFHGTPENYYLYYEALNKFKPQWILGFPSCIVPFASFLIENGLKIQSDIRFITLGAENLYEYQKKILNKAFGCVPFIHYGMTEAVANFSENLDEITEVDEDFAATEFIRDGDSYRIVGTNLINYSMPLLRYDTGDLADYDGKIGKQGRIVNFVDGRTGDCLVFPDGRRIGAFSALFTETSHIKEAQIYQYKDYHVEIRFVPTDYEWQEDLQIVENKLKERIKNTLDYQFVKVDKIERTKRGKIRYIISEINENNNI